MNIRAPGDDELRVGELLGLGAIAEAERGVLRGPAGAGANGAVEARRAQAMEEAAVHAGAVEQAHGAGVAVGQNRLGAVLLRDGGQAARDGVERFIPGDAREAAFAFGAGALLRIEQAVGRIFALQILRDFAAQEPARDGMGGVAAQAGGAAVFHVDQQGAGVGAIERADGVPNLHTSRITIKLHEITKRNPSPETTRRIYRHNQTNPRQS